MLFGIKKTIPRQTTTNTIRHRAAGVMGVNQGWMIRIPAPAGKGCPLAVGTIYTNIRVHSEGLGLRRRIGVETGLAGTGDPFTCSLSGAPDPLRLHPDPHLETHQINHGDPAAGIQIGG